MLTDDPNESALWGEGKPISMTFHALDGTERKYTLGDVVIFNHGTQGVIVRMEETRARHDPRRPVLRLVMEDLGGDEVTARVSALSPRSWPVIADRHDFHPVFEGCVKCGALPGESLACEMEDK